MPKVIVCSGSVNPATSVVNTTEYWDVYGYTDKGTNSDYRTGAIYDDGTLSRLKVKIVNNSVPSPGITFTLLVNGAAGNQTISVPDSSSGFFEDSSHNDVVAWGDDVVLKAVPASTGTYQVAYVMMLYGPATFGQTTSHFKTGHVSGRTYATASTTFFNNLNSYMDTNNSSTEANVQHKIKMAGSMLGLQAWVTSNARTTATTIRIRKNGVAQTPTISIGNQLSGWFGDEATSFTVAVDDLLNYAIITGTGTQNILVTHITSAIDIADNSRYASFLGQNMLGPTQSRNISRYYPFCGYFDVQTTESAVQFEIPPQAFMAKNLNIYISANSIANTSTFALRKNGVTTSLSASITASTAGWYQDVTHSEILVEDDLIDYILVTGTGSGSQTLAARSYGVVLETSINMTIDSTVIVDDKMITRV